MTDGFTLRLPSVPPELMLGLAAALDALQREVQVTALDDAGPSAVARSTHDALVEGRARVEVARNQLLDQATAARDAGHDRADLSATYRDEDVAAFRTARTGADAADAAARRGELLAAPLSPAERHLWEWIGAQFAAQVEGADPTPYEPEG